MTSEKHSQSRLHGEPPSFNTTRSFTRGGRRRIRSVVHQSDASKAELRLNNAPSSHWPGEGATVECKIPGQTRRTFW